MLAFPLPSLSQSGCELSRITQAPVAMDARVEKKGFTEAQIAGPIRTPADEIGIDAGEAALALSVTANRRDRASPQRQHRQA